MDLSLLVSNEHPGVPPSAELSGPLDHPRNLAHLGDAIYELWVRHCVHQALGAVSSAVLHKACTSLVRADFQAQLYEEIHPNLAEAEQQLGKQARNLKVTTKRRGDQALYRQATAFEALMGYWYLYERLRLNEVLKRWILPELQKALFVDEGV